MFQDDIDRKINGVVKVDQDAADVLKQEVQEYVITRDIRSHMITFFNNYAEAFREPTADTILFNIDIEGSINKDKTAVLRVFAKMFYHYLGFYGENLKCAKMEQFINKKGKTEEFRRVFEEKNGSSWVESRDAFAFFEDDVVETLMEVLGMSETAAHNWFDGTETVETSIAQLVMQDASTSERVKLNKQLTKFQAQAEETRIYEEKIHHLADQMISIDLDDGVKVNYAKLQDVLAKIK